jgi:hypothetical protein
MKYRFTKEEWKEIEKLARMNHLGEHERLAQAIARGWIQKSKLEEFESYYCIYRSINGYDEESKIEKRTFDTLYHYAKQVIAELQEQIK